MVPSGEQYEIAYGQQRATLVEVGGGLREYSVGDRPVLDPYRVDAMRDGAHGAPLIPWPNRLADGQYRFDGTDYQVALTEPEKHNAIHGFLLWRSWEAREHESERVVMGTRLRPLMGYPFALDVAVEYELSDAGLTVTTSVENVGDSACPYGCGQHPYLSPGAGGLVDDCTLEVPARTRVMTDDERQLPIGLEPVDGTRYDFRAARQLGDEKIDFAFTDLVRDESDLAVVRLAAPDGRSAELWVDERYRYVEIYTGDTLAPDRRRRGLGVEPMTCAPNGFRSGEGLIRLEPGESFTTRWGARLA